MGEGVGRSQSVIVVRDDLGVLEIFANQFESKAETAHAICGLAQKWQIGLEGIIFDGNGNTGRDILRALERRYPYGLEPFLGSRPGGRWYTNLRTACAAAWNPSFLRNPSAMHSRLEKVGGMGPPGGLIPRPPIYPGQRCLAERSRSDG